MVELNPNLLDKYFPFVDLPSGDRLRLVQMVETFDVLAGEKIYAHDSQGWLLYLLEGKVDYCLPYLQPELVSAGDDRAHHPLFQQTEEQDTHIETITACKFFRVDRKFFNTLLDQEVMITESSTSAGMDVVSATLYNEIVQAIESGRLKLPSLPEIALRVKEAVNKDTVGVNELSHIVESDPAMVVRLIQVANSPISRGVEPINSIRDAIVRLGLSMTQNLVMSLAVKQLFKTEHQVLKKQMQRLYVHSIEIAAISFALASKSKLLDPDQMLLAGLLHDIGVIPIISYIDETGLVIKDETEVESIISTLKASVGSMIIKNWDFPNEMITVVEQAENWFRQSGDKIDMTDIIVAAQIYNMLQHKQVKNLPDINKVPVFKKMFPEKQDPKFAMEVLEQAKEEIAEVKRLLEL